MAFLDPDRIPEELFDAGALKESEIQSLTTHSDFELTFLELQRYSLVTKTSGINTSTLSMHCQIRRYAHNQLDPTMLQNAFNGILFLVRKVFPRQPHFAEPLSAEWPNSKSNLERGKNKSGGRNATVLDEIQLANAYNNLVGIYCALGHLDEAEINNKLSLALKERWKNQANQPNLDYLFSLSYSNMANMYGHQGHWEKAEGYYTMSLEVGKSSPDTLRRAPTYHNFGYMRLLQGRAKEAQELLTEAFQLRSEELGDHHDTVSTLHMLASCHHHLHQLTEASFYGRDLFYEAIRILESMAIQSLFETRIACSMFKLSLVLRDLNDPRAEEYKMKAHVILVETLGSSENLEENEDAYDNLAAYI
ncbi:MAG: hypothetical protein M1834_003347 [Cirrosporium novae-zelandiae]|nr:MAG: hypothetical protein M1834_003347 [Cirrosporium novae-zelandiae]